MRNRGLLLKAGRIQRTRLISSGQPIESQERKSRGSNPFSFAMSSKNLLQFRMSFQYPVGFRFFDERIDPTARRKFISKKEREENKEDEREHSQPLRMELGSFHWLTTSSHCKSFLNRWRVGNLGFLEVNKYP